MEAQPSGTGPRWGSQWRAEGMAAAYDARHPWRGEVADVLAPLRVRDLPVLEIGAGNGRLTRLLVGAGLTPVDAVEPSAAMISRSGLAAGDGVRWIESTFEDALLSGPYGLAVCAESVHWLDWSTAFGRLAALLAPEAPLVLVGLLESAPGAARPGSQSWLPDVLPVIAELSTNVEFVPYHGVEEMIRRGYFELLGETTTAWVRRSVPVDEVVRRYHSMNGMSPERLGPAAMAEFARRARAAIAAHADPADGLIHTDVAADIRWGRPLA